jgi:hypothetical protein
MKVRDILDRVDVGTEIFVVKPVVIRWESMRFDYTKIVFAKYVVVENTSTGLWGTNSENFLKVVDMPEGTKQYTPNIMSNNIDYNCFLTKEEAEVWKVIELHNLEKVVDDHIKTLREKTQKKIKKIKVDECFETYLEKYPDAFLKVM